jgi:gamma-glutamyltranspeptidase/glutathione hydrolase
VRRHMTIAALIVSAATLLLGQTPLNLHGRAANGKNGVVAAAKPEASQVGVEILKKGGNAVDAAIATGFALGVLEPNASGIGGGGFMIIKLANMKEAVVIDFREVAPGGAKPDMFKFDDKGKVVDNASVVGGLANGVPGEVAGLLYALDHYGSKKLTRAQILQPAIAWANKGIPVTVNLAGIIKDNFETIKKFPACASIYLKDGLPYEIGDTIKNPDLARTLKLVARGRTPSTRARSPR